MQTTSRFSKWRCNGYVMLICGGWNGGQVKVWLGTNADHYYVLSRFLVSRMLLVTKVRTFKESIAISVFGLCYELQIELDLKKLSGTMQRRSWQQSF